MVSAASGHSRATQRGTAEAVNPAERVEKRAADTLPGVLLPPLVISKLEVGRASGRDGGGPVSGVSAVREQSAPYQDDVPLGAMNPLQGSVNSGILTNMRNGMDGAEPLMTVHPQMTWKPVARNLL